MAEITFFFIFGSEKHKNLFWRFDFFRSNFFCLNATHPNQLQNRFLHELPFHIIRIWYARGLFIAISFALIFHFEGNIISLLIGVLFFLLSGLVSHDKILIIDNNIEIQKRYLFSTICYFNTYNFKDIKDIIVPEYHISESLFEQLSYYALQHKLYILFKNDEQKEFRTTIPRNELRAFLKAYKQLQK